MPFAAGISDMRYRTFVLFDTIGATVWGAGTIVAGFFLGETAQRVFERYGTWGGLTFGALVVIVGVMVWRKRRVPMTRQGPVIDSHSSIRPSSQAWNPPASRMSVRKRASSRSNRRSSAGVQGRGHRVDITGLRYAINLPPPREQRSTELLPRTTAGSAEAGMEEGLDRSDRAAMRQRAGAS